MKGHPHSISDPPFAKFVFGNTRTALLWLVVRVYVGWAWLHAGWGKVGADAWTGDSAGTALAGFVARALEKTGGAHPDVQAWYGWFLENCILPYAPFWGHVIAYGETLVGLALIAGAFTGIAAFFGAFMNLNFLLAGTVSINPVLAPLAVLLALAWKVAGWWGADRWLLPRLGVPWR
ncbi:MAG TPA: DoxX family protein [Candidatus Paceibacterota bacterium]|nr:DoxX family protein [Candidatus Paceibacterota bacterium]